MSKKSVDKKFLIIFFFLINIKVPGIFESLPDACTY